MVYCLSQLYQVQPIGPYNLGRLVQFFDISIVWDRAELPASSKKKVKIEKDMESSSFKLDPCNICENMHFSKIVKQYQSHFTVSLTPAL